MQQLTVILNDSCNEKRLILTETTFDQTDVDTINLWLSGKIGAELLNPFEVDDLDVVIATNRIWWRESAHLVDIYWGEIE